MLAVVAVGAMPAGADADAALTQLVTEWWQRVGSEQGDAPYLVHAQAQLQGLAVHDSAARERWARDLDGLLQALKQLPRSDLSTERQQFLDAFTYHRRMDRAAFDQPLHYFLVDSEGAWHRRFVAMLASLPLVEESDFDRYLVLLSDYPRLNRENLGYLQSGAEGGYTPHCHSMRNFAEELESDVDMQVALLAPLSALPDTLRSDAQVRVSQRGGVLIRRAVIPAYDEFRRFYQQQYLPHCREEPGIAAVPGGAEFYRFLIALQVSAAYDPLVLHERALAEVEQLSAAMRDPLTASGYQGSVAGFLQMLREEEVQRSVWPAEQFAPAAQVTAEVALQGVIDYRWAALFEEILAGREEASAVDTLLALAEQRERMARVVVDTGIHAQSWSVAQARAYLAETTYLGDELLDRQLAAVITRPATALTEPVRILALVELREQAQQRLGNGYRDRDLAEALEQRAALPLELLIPSIREWICQARAEEDCE